MKSRVNFKKFKTKDLYAKGAWIQGPNSVQNSSEIEEIRSLKVNWWLNWKVSRV